MDRDRQEKLLRALNDVGDDLVAMARERRFGVSPWRRWGALAASLALVVSLTALALPYFPMGCGSSSDSAAETQATAEDIFCDTESFSVSGADGTTPLDSEPQELPECECEEETVMEAEPEADPESPAEEAPDLDRMVEELVQPLERWQVGTFEDASQLTEDALERLALAVEERDGIFNGTPSAAAESFVRTSLDRVLEGYTYAPEDAALPWDCALEELPLLEPVGLEEGENTILLVLRTDAQGAQTLLAYELARDGDGWKYVSVTVRQQ